MARCRGTHLPWCLHSSRCRRQGHWPSGRSRFCELMIRPRWKLGNPGVADLNEHAVVHFQSERPALKRRRSAGSQRLAYFLDGAWLGASITKVPKAITAQRLQRTKFLAQCIVRFLQIRIGNREAEFWGTNWKSLLCRPACVQSVFADGRVHQSGSVGQ